MCGIHELLVCHELLVWGVPASYTCGNVSQMQEAGNQPSAVTREGKDREAERKNANLLEVSCAEQYVTALDGEFVQQDLVLRPHRSNVHAVLVRQERVDCFLLLLLGRFLLGVRGGEGACIMRIKKS